MTSIQFSDVSTEKPKKKRRKKKRTKLTQEPMTTQWWQKPSIQYAFSHPQIRSRLERLMGSNYVSLTDRIYMQRLQERILEEYEEAMDKRIKVREDEELERVKNLVLNGKIPMRHAPAEMDRHPVMLIEKYCNQLIAERRAKIKIPKIKIPTYLYWDDTPDPPSGLSIQKGHVFRKQGDNVCVPADIYLSYDQDEDIDRGYMMLDEDYDRIKYEHPLVKALKACEYTDELYELADQIIGELKTITDADKVQTDNISADAPS